MRAVRTLFLTTVLALTVAGPAWAAPAETPPDIPMAIVQSVTLIPDRLVGMRTVPPHVPESGLLLVVGSALIGLGTAVRRRTK